MRWLLLLLLVGCVRVEPPEPTAPIDSGLGISLPPGFVIEEFANLNSKYQRAQPRFMEIKDGILYVAIPSAGVIASVSDNDGDGTAESIESIATGLDRAHDFAFYGDDIFIAEQTRVSRGKIGQTLSPVVTRIPTGGHWTRTIVMHDDELFLSVGSSCNVCNENNEIRAAISKCTLEGDCTVISKGLRNSVGMVFVGDTLYATDNGRDMIGDNIPPEEINVILEGKDYGWPYCYGNKVEDLTYSKVNDCKNTEPAFVEMQAHSAPLGIAYYDADLFPQQYRSKLFVAFHGSWNRNEKTGYKIVMVDPNTKEVSDFATGWLKDGKVTGRPVDIVVSPDGSLFVSDDSNGKIYKITYAKN